jgi:ERCC4-type nuclease
VVIDTREQTPFPTTRLRSVRASLSAGDYAILGAETQAAIERKSIHDLVGCCSGSSRERFERELARMEAYRFKRLMVVGSREEIEAEMYFSNISPKAVLAGLGGPRRCATTFQLSSRRRQRPQLSR